MIAPRKLVLIGMTIAATGTFTSSLAHAAAAKASAKALAPATAKLASAAAAPLLTPNAWSGGVAHPQYGVSQSSPITVSRSGAAQVVVADSGGRL
jgi:hypothetical protein